MIVEFAGERLELRADRSAFWPARSTLFVADLHLTKEATFQARGLAVPTGSTDRTLQELAEAIVDAKAERVVILGDLWHASEAFAQHHLQTLAAWVEDQPAEVALVPGNHDRWRSREHAAQVGIAEWPDPHELGPFTLKHHPACDPDAPVICGHVHPAIRLRSGRRWSQKLECFWMRPGCLVLPAFGDFHGTAIVKLAPEDRAFVIAGQTVLEVPSPVRARS